MCVVCGLHCVSCLLEQLKEAHEKIEAIYLERLEQAEKEQAANAEHRAKAG